MHEGYGEKTPRFCAEEIAVCAIELDQREGLQKAGKGERGGGDDARGQEQCHRSDTIRDASA